MSEELKIFIIFFIWLFSAYFGSFSSGGVSALSIGIMVMFGISPQMAGITFKLWKIWDNIGWLILFYKNWFIPKKYILWCWIAMFLGSSIGSYFIIQIPDIIMYFGCGVSMLFLSIFSFMKKDVKWIVVPKFQIYLGYITHFFISIVGNLFPAWSGIWYYFNNTLIFWMSTLESKGIASVSSFFWFMGTFTWILIAGQYNLSWWIALGIGMLIGWYFGTKHIIKIWDEQLKIFVLLSILLFSLYFLYRWIMLL